MLNKIKKHNLKLFDITLRDGLQSLGIKWSLLQKIELFDTISKVYKPKNIEIGSIVSKKILPQMEDSDKLYQFATINKDIYKSNNYMLLPTLKSYNKCLLIPDLDINNVSLITSVSEDFIMKNTGKKEVEMIVEISNMIKAINFNNVDTGIKLYISCINHCPIAGKIDNEETIKKIVYYYTYFSKDIDEYCLSDTCGNLKYDDYKFIIDNLLDIIPSEKIGLHLHLSETNQNIKEIINYSISRNIKKFDVSCLSDTGGCTVTIEKGKVKSNLTYQQLESML